MQTFRTPLLRSAVAIAVVFSVVQASLAQPPAKSKSFTVYYLKHAVAKDVETTLNAFFPDDLRVVADARTNALFVRADEDVLKEVEGLLKVLDKSGAAAVRDAGNEVKVFQLANADASEMMEVVSKLVGKDMRLVPDRQSNSLVATGRKDQLATVEAILLRLDRHDRDRAEKVRSIPVGHATVDEVLNTLISLNLAGDARIAANRNRLLVNANDKTFELLEKTIVDLDRVAFESNNRLQMRIIWLVDEKLAGKDAAPPSKSLDGVVQVLKEKLGMESLKLGAQMLVTINADGERDADGARRSNRQRNPFNDGSNAHFDAQGTAQMSDTSVVQLKASGRIVGRSGSNPLVQVEIQAILEPSNAGKRTGKAGIGASEQLASLTTKIAAPPGHSVVLGVTPIRSADSVFILQVLPELRAEPKRAKK